MSALVSTSRARNSHIFEREPEDHYVEPRRCSERLFEILRLPPETTVWDPACGFGRIVRAAAAAGLRAFGTDLRPRWIDNPDGPHAAATTFEVLDVFSPAADRMRADVIASNPPFDEAQAFAERALARSNRMVALLLPDNWLYGTKRSRWRQTTPLHLVMPINPRPSMPPGHVIADGGKAAGGTKNFAWFVWLHGFQGAPTVLDCLLDEGRPTP